MLRCTNVRSGIAKLWDCTIRPRKESDGRDCALGWQFELYRCHLSRGVDGVGIYKTSAPYAAAVKVKGCLIEDLAFTYPDRDHSDGTHTDCIQIQGGTDIEIVGNSLRGTAHYMAGSGTFYTANPTASTGDWPVAKSGVTAGAGIIVEANVAPVDSSVIISQNWIRWCKAQLLIKASANGFVCTGNRLSSVNPPASNVSGSVVAGSPLNFTYNPYWCRFDSLSASGSVSGLTSGGALANTTNVWLDGPNAGQPLATPRANGVATDA